jgi:chain length determinant protein EpsF
MTISQVFLMLWARRWIAIFVFAVIVLAVMSVTLILPREYVATASVVADSKGTNPITGTVLPSQLLAGYMATQVDVISSHNVALKVVDKLKLVDSPAVRERFNSITTGSGTARDWMADVLLRDLDVQPARDSSVISIAFSGRDPAYAATLANAFADSYIQTSLELRNDPARRQAEWFDDQIRTLRKALEESQQKLGAYQRENNLVSVDPNRLDVENARLGEIANQLTAAQGVKYDSISRLNQLKQLKGQEGLMQLPDILGNGLLQNMKAELARSEAKLAEIAERYDRNHPQYISAAAEVNALRSKLWAEIGTARGAIDQSAKLAERREGELQQALEQQKQTILELQKQRDQQAVLYREVENAQRTYDAAMQRSSQVRMESEFTQSNIAVLNPAIPPMNPSKPHVMLNLILSIIAGALLGAASALLMELRDRRVRDYHDLLGSLDAPLLAELPPVNARGRKGGRGTELVPA